MLPPPLALTRITLKGLFLSFRGDWKVLLHSRDKENLTPQKNPFLSANWSNRSWWNGDPRRGKPQRSHPTYRGNVAQISTCCYWTWPAVCFCHRCVQSSASFSNFNRTGFFFIFLRNWHRTVINFQLEEMYSALKQVFRGQLHFPHEFVFQILRVWKRKSSTCFGIVRLPVSFTTFVPWILLVVTICVTVGRIDWNTFIWVPWSCHWHGTESYSLFCPSLLGIGHAYTICHALEKFCKSNSSSVNGSACSQLSIPALMLWSSGTVRSLIASPCTF